MIIDQFDFTSSGTSLVYALIVNVQSFFAAYPNASPKQMKKSSIWVPMDNLQDHNFEHEVSLVYFKFIFQALKKVNFCPLVHERSFQDLKVNFLSLGIESSFYRPKKTGIL